MSIKKNQAKSFYLIFQTVEINILVNLFRINLLRGSVFDGTHKDLRIRLTLTATLPVNQLLHRCGCCLLAPLRSRELIALAGAAAPDEKLSRREQITSSRGPHHSLAVYGRIMKHILCNLYPDVTVRHELEHNISYFLTGY